MSEYLMREMDESDRDNGLDLRANALQYLSEGLEQMQVLTDESGINDLYVPTIVSINEIVEAKSSSGIRRSSKRLGAICLCSDGNCYTITRTAGYVAGTRDEPADEEDETSWEKHEQS